MMLVAHTTTLAAPLRSLRTGPVDSHPQALRRLVWIGWYNRRFGSAYFDGVLRVIR